MRTARRACVTIGISALVLLTTALSASAQQRDGHELQQRLTGWHLLVFLFGFGIVGAGAVVFSVLWLARRRRQARTGESTTTLYCNRCGAVIAGDAVECPSCFAHVPRMELTRG